MTGFATGPISLISLRTLAAVLGAATQPASMALIFSVYDRSDRVRAMGWWSMTGAAAPALGLIAGGPLVDWLGWRVVFLLGMLGFRIGERGAALVGCSIMTGELVTMAYGVAQREIIVVGAGLVFQGLGHGLGFRH